MKVWFFSHIGNSRGNQEDNALVGTFYYDLNAIRALSPEHPINYRGIECNETSDTLLAVSDGMGGHSSGEVASYLTLKYLSEHNDSAIQCDKEELIQLLADLNREISNVAQGDSENRGMGATLCGVICRAQQMLGFNVGDSRLYRFENGELTQLTTDHSAGQRLLDLKLLTEDELKSVPNRKAIYKYIGMETELVADVFDIAPCESGTILLLCTDGLSDVLTDDEMRQILAGEGSLKEKGETMLNTALDRHLGFGDNITIILTEF